MHKWWWSILDRRTVLWLVRLHGTHQRGYQMVATLYHIWEATFGRKKQLNNWINFSNYYWEEWHLWLYRYRSLQAYVSNDEQCSLSSASSTIPNGTPKKKIGATSILKLTDWKQLRNLTKSFYVFQSKA